MAISTLNGKPRRSFPIPNPQGDPLTIPLTVGGRNGLQPHTEGKFI